jgi:uncharacterized protein (TIGR00297 family)
LPGTRDEGPRKISQVLANGGLSALLAIAVLVDPKSEPLMSFLIACSLASAAADTVSSELGIIYGSSAYNVITFKKDQRGLDGVVSIEGTFFGVLAAALIAVNYYLFFRGVYPFWLIITAGTIGNYADSFLGATLERRRLLSNDVVNFLNTLIAAVAGLLMTIIFS